MFPSSVENLSQTREWTYTIEGRSSQAGHDRQALGLFLQKYVSNFHAPTRFTVGGGAERRPAQRIPRVKNTCGKN